MPASMASPWGSDGLPKNCQALWLKILANSFVISTEFFAAMAFEFSQSATLKLGSEIDEKAPSRGFFFWRVLLNSSARPGV
jgi:hypothetical protein